MSVANLSIKFRPTRIGFLVNDGDIEALVTIAGINSLLYGGIYNPVIPISEANEFAERLLEVFNVDVIYPISKGDRIDEFLARHEYLHNPHFVSTDLFYEDWETKKKKIMYLDTLNVIRYYQETGFTKRSTQGFDYLYVIVKWPASHQFKELCALSFGYYPDSLDLKDNFEDSFLYGLSGKVIRLLEADEIVSPAISGSVTPILLTGSELKLFDERTDGDGFYVGDEKDFTDLCFFWNMRATGIALEFLPINHLEKFDGTFRQYLGQLDNALRSSSKRHKVIPAYCVSKRYEEVKEVVKSYKTENPISPSPCDAEVIWNGLNLRPSNSYFAAGQTLATVHKSSSGYDVSFNLPEITIAKRQDRHIERQSFVASVEPMKEDGVYPEHTLKPPFIRQLNAFYSGRIIGDRFKLRVEKYGVRVIVEGREYSLTLSLVSYQSVIKELFGLAGLKVEISQPGVMAKQILKKLGGIEGARVFKIAGVRRLLRQLKKDDDIDKGHATLTILRKMQFKEGELRLLLGADFDDVVSSHFSRNEESGTFAWAENVKKDADITDERLKDLYRGDFRRFEELYIEPRSGAKLTTSSVFRFLLRKEFFRAGLKLRCYDCGLKSWLSLREIDDYWVCNYCGHKNQMSIQLTNECHWRYRKSGLFAKDNNQEGAIPVLLTLLQFHRRFSSLGYGYSPALRIRGEGIDCEADLCVLQYGVGGEIEIGIAECKSEGVLVTPEDASGDQTYVHKQARKGERGLITPKDIDNLKSVRERLKKIGIRCSLVFSKTADRFDEGEIELFKELAAEEIDCILLLNRELEPSEPYEAYDKNQMLDKHASTLNSMAWNARKFYLES